MTIYQPVTERSAAIIRPPCPRCGAPRMMLARIEPDKPDHEKRSFECPNCGNELSEVVKFK
jgi:predicted RNA-binding Zn-ribbon protein involved in translation (DUF1610 family)